MESRLASRHVAERRLKKIQSVRHLGGNPSTYLIACAPWRRTICRSIHCSPDLDATHVKRRAQTSTCQLFRSNPDSQCTGLSLNVDCTVSAHEVRSSSSSIERPVQKYWQYALSTDQHEPSAQTCKASFRAARCSRAVTLFATHWMSTWPVPERAGSRSQAESAQRLRSSRVVAHAIS